jgi:hypothetical protein
MAKNYTSGQKKGTTLQPLTNNEQPHLKTLLKHKHYHDMIVNSGELVNFWDDVQNELLEVYRLKEPHYNYNRRCPACVCEFLVNLYKLYKDDLHTSNSNNIS